MSTAESRTAARPTAPVEPRAGTRPTPAAARGWTAEISPALRFTAITLVLTGLVYPFAVTGVAQALFGHQANGSLVRSPDGAVLGSELLSQAFGRPGYFQPRPSAAGEGHDPRASGGSNLGPTSRKLRDLAEARLAALVKDNPAAPGPPPVELVTASASGLDRDISPAAARWQLPRVAAARGIEPERIQAVVDEVTEGRDLGLLGERRVNVLLLNLALDRRFGAPAAAEAPR